MDGTTTTTTTTGRRIVHRTRGQKHGPIRRLISPHDVGELTKPFVFLDHFDFEAKAEPMFGIHPHSGIATLTVLVDGDVTYEDTTGKSGVLPAGGVEWMKAGLGVWHDGAPVRAGRFHGWQLWVALPPVDENGPAESQYVAPDDVPVVGPARIALGTYEGKASPIATTSSMNYLRVALKAGERWTYVPPPTHEVAWLHVEGKLRVAGAVLTDELAVFDESAAPLAFEAETDVTFVLGSAEKHEHELVLGRSSVHTTEDALVNGQREIIRIGKMLHRAGRL